MLLLSVGYPLLSIDKIKLDWAPSFFNNVCKEWEEPGRRCSSCYLLFFDAAISCPLGPFHKAHHNTNTHTLYCPLTISTPFRFLTSGKRAGPPFRPFFFLYATNLTKRERRNESNNTCLILGTQLRIRSFFIIIRKNSKISPDSICYSLVVCAYSRRDYNWPAFLVTADCAARRLLSDTRRATRFRDCDDR
jgi:hypothetical protein